MRLATAICVMAALVAPGAFQAARAEEPTCSGYTSTYGSGDLNAAEAMVIADVKDLPHTDGSNYTITANAVAKHGWKTVLAALDRNCGKLRDQGSFPALGAAINMIPLNEAFGTI